MKGLHDHLAQCHHKLARGRVWCHRCHHTLKIPVVPALRHGWPRCCGQTMSIDSPEEHWALTHPAPRPAPRPRPLVPA